MKKTRILGIALLSILLLNGCEKVTSSPNGIDIKMHDAFSSKEAAKDNELLKTIKMTLPLIYDTIQIWAKREKFDPNTLTGEDIEKFASSEDFAVIYKLELDKFCIKNPNSCACTECK